MQTHPTTLADWLSLLESMHPKAIDMGLERVAKVKQRLEIQFECPVIIVGGTNGKGSTCAMLESILLQAGYRVGLYTSPHLLHFNERARVGGASVSDAALIASFEAVEAKRGDVSLTYFEFTTLAVMRLFALAGLDAIVLEVGLGGRLDAVNVIDADVAIVTSVDIDHTDYLGSTREEIGFEKAGIFRAGRAAICGDPMPPTAGRCAVCARAKPATARAIRPPKIMGRTENAPMLQPPGQILLRRYSIRKSRRASGARL